MKKCSKCKQTKPLVEFNKTSSNKDGLSYLCQPCNLKVTRDYRSKNRDKYNLNQKTYRSNTEGFISQLLHGAKTRAKKKGFAFSLTNQDIEDMMVKGDMKCSLTGLSMNLESSGRKKANAFKCSLDRIDSNLGYTLDNVRLVCWAVNQMKADRTDEEFAFWINILSKTISSQAPTGEGSTTIPQGSTLK